MLINPVAVEKVARHEFAEIASRQEALQTIFPSLPDIFYHPIVDFFRENRVFQQPQDLSTPIREWVMSAALLGQSAACADQTASQSLFEWKYDGQRHKYRLVTLD